MLIFPGSVAPEKWAALECCSLTKAATANGKQFNAKSQRYAIMARKRLLLCRILESMCAV